MQSPSVLRGGQRLAGGVAVDRWRRLGWCRQVDLGMLGVKVKVSVHQETLFLLQASFSQGFDCSSLLCTLTPNTDSVLLEFVLEFSKHGCLDSTH